MSGRSNKFKSSQFKYGKEDPTSKGRLTSSVEYGEKLYSPPHSNISKLEIDIDKLKKNIEHLAQHEDVLIEKLSSDLIIIFEVVSKDMVKMYNGEIDLYNQVVNDTVLKCFKTQNARPKTVGSYFVGCSAKHNNSNNLSCSASCINSLPHLENKSCDDLVLVYTPSKIIKALNNPSNPTTAQIYIEEPGKFTGFSTSDVAAFKSRKITTIIVIKGTEQTTYKVDELPMSSQPTSSNSGWVALGIILFLLIAGGIGYVAVKGNNIHFMDL